MKNIYCSQRLKSALRFHPSRIGDAEALLSAAAEYGYEISLADPKTGNVLFDFHRGPTDTVTARIIRSHLATVPGAIPVTRVPANFIAFDIPRDAPCGWLGLHVIACLWGATDARLDCDLPSRWEGCRMWTYLPDAELPARSFFANDPEPFQERAPHIGSFLSSFGISVLVPGEVIALEPLSGFTNEDMLAGPAWALPHFDLRDPAQPRWLLDLSKYNSTDRTLFHHYGHTPDAFWRSLSMDGGSSIMSPEDAVQPPIGAEMLAEDLRRLWSADTVEAAAGRWQRILAAAEAREIAAKNCMMNMYWRGPRQASALSLVELRQMASQGADDAELTAAAMPICLEQMRWRRAHSMPRKTVHNAFTPPVYISGQLQEGPKS